VIQHLRVRKMPALDWKPFEQDAASSLLPQTRVAPNTTAGTSFCKIQLSAIPDYNVHKGGANRG